MSFAGKNMKYLRKTKGWTQEEFANKVGIKRSLVGAYEEERAEPRLEVLEVICQLFKLSLEDVLLKDLSDAGETYLTRRRQMKLGADRAAAIQFVPVKAAAGYLAGYNDPEFVDELNTFTLPMLGPGEYRAFEIIGDSMLPTPSGSVIVGEKVDNFEYVKNDTACIVVSRTDGIVYKRVQKQPREKKILTLVSDNPNYPPYTVKTDEVAELWKAQLVLSKPQEKPVWDVSQLANVVSSLHQQLSSLQTK
ncbi:MAG: LexA family transcriptional regulator [Chitinophagaceae bacterium]|nr:LexA family transcriptional regulator [Chitinophagaceae bacterium]